MDRLNIIREVLDYTSYHNEKTIILKIQKEIIEKARSLGIIEDITRLRKNGIKLIIIHDSPNVDPKKWYKLKNSARSFNLKNNEKIIEMLNLGLIPVIKYEDGNGIKTININEMGVLIGEKIKARKIIYMTNRDGLFDQNHKLIREISIKQAEELLKRNGWITGEMRDILEKAILACNKGVNRVHIISGLRPGTLLEEMFTCNGIGTMIFKKKEGYHNIKWASKEDTQSILYIIKKSIFGSFDFKQIENRINDFIIFTVDNQIYGCCQASLDKKKSIIEICYLSIFNEFNDITVVKNMLNFILTYARKNKFNYLFLPAQKNCVTLGLYPWFSDMGFKMGKIKKNGWIYKI